MENLAEIDDQFKLNLIFLRLAEDRSDWLIEYCSDRLRLPFSFYRFNFFSNFKSKEK